MTEPPPEPPPGSPSPSDTRPFTRPGLGKGVAWLLLAVALLLHGPRLGGPFPDGQAGNCGAMFALFARNAAALGAPAVLVPVVNPVPPTGDEPALAYTHHPPGLPWLVMAAGLLPVPIETAARLVALALTLLSVLLLADLAARLAGRRAALATGLTALLLPAGLHHGLLVNYETVALPPLLALVRVLLLERGKAAVVAALAALADWIAVTPLLFVLLTGSVCRARWLRASLAVAVVVAGVAWLGRRAAPAAPAETLQQALLATFLSPAFEFEAWRDGMARHLASLYGWALLPATIALLTLPIRPRLLRRVLLTLLAVGLFNVIAFAFHATSHEHFSLLLLPFVALATGTLLFPRGVAARPPALLGAAALVVVLSLGVTQARGEWSARSSTFLAERADALAAVTDTDQLLLLPGGASFVFLHRAARHVAPEPAGDLASARAAAERYRARFGRPDLPAFVALWTADPTPAWTEPLGEGRSVGPWRLLELP